MNSTLKTNKMGMTASTMPHHTTSSFLFPQRSPQSKRLNSTIRLADPPPMHNKFNLIPDRSISWNKWKAHNFPSPWQGFQGLLKQRVEKKVEKERREEGPEELKLRRKIREVMRLKEEIERTRHNKQLIVAIEDYHEKKINGFFDQL